MIRVVLDTNILISALLSPQGRPMQVWLMVILQSDTQLCVSGDVYAEYEEVVRRPRLNRSESEITARLRAVRENGLWVIPTERCVPVRIPMTTFSWSVRRRPLRNSW